MKRILASLMLIFLSGCATLEQMNKNLEQSIETVEKNTVAVDCSRETIAENSKVVGQATALFRPPAGILVAIIVLGLFAAFFFSLLTLRDVQKNLRRLVNQESKSKRKT